jgi:hypothetical protein
MGLCPGNFCSEWHEFYEFFVFFRGVGRFFGKFYRKEREGRKGKKILAFLACFVVPFILDDGVVFLGNFTTKSAKDAKKYSSWRSSRPGSLGFRMV